MNLLLVTSSLFAEASQSRQIAREFVETWQRDNPGTRVVERDLTAETMPHLTQATLGAVMTPADRRTPVQAELARFADSLIEEVEAADTIVLAAPMYNFTISTTLKAWIEHIARAGRTFRYTANGPEGLLKGRKVYIVTGRGGVYSGESPARKMDFQEPYLRGMLGLLGLTDLDFIHIEGLNISKDAAEAGRARARETIVALRPKLAA
jgi:FMN-dependent NADH-azoreductase